MMDSLFSPEIIDDACRLAASWQNRANELLTSEEKEIQEQMKRLLTRPLDKVVLTKLIDQSFRSHDPNRVANRVSSILLEYGTPDFFSRVEKILIQMFLGLGRHFPALTVPSVIEKMRNASSRAILPGEAKALKAHLNRRKSQGVRMNINHLGEAVLGEGQAQQRLNTYIDDLKSPDIEHISIKISTIYSQINVLAFDHTVDVLKARLSALYYEAKSHFFQHSDGSRTPKFINLDMEEYRDMAITCEAFARTLDQPQYKDYSAGLALQAYLPDAHLIQKELTNWAMRRIDAGGAPIRLRIVKGANMEMEKLESVLFNWPLAPYDNKLAVDANYKRMVAYGMVPERLSAVHLGIASHNLFDLAFAYTLAQRQQVADGYNFEMLEGMADHVRRAIYETTGDILLYAPVARREEFINAIAYLIRRLDENTSPENFLRYIPELQVASDEWKMLENGFKASSRYVGKAFLGSHRMQNRMAETFPEDMGTLHEREFYNEPNTDWSLAVNRQWAEGIRNRWEKDTGQPSLRIPVVIDGEERFSGRRLRERLDPNQLPHKITISRCALASETDLQQAVAVSKRDPDNWRGKTLLQRHEIISQVAVALRKARGRLIGAAAAETGKLFAEADVEVSEAIDFAEFYPFSVKGFHEIDGIKSKGKGVGLVISPWNFPVAIPCGGIIASLAAGNTVIFKPSSEAALTAWELCKCFWDAGISKKVLQFVPFAGSETGSRLIPHPDIDYIILTGGTETGLALLSQSPGIYLAAETGGKNATIVTDMADRDQAIKNVLYSAFGNSGQKCSATSLLVLEKQVYDDAHFKQQLVDAAESMLVGSAWRFENKMGPLIHPPEDHLLRALTRLEPGESWALKPRNLSGNPCLWSPGIKWDVSSGSYTHMTEFFGPLLAVLRAVDLDHAICLVNQTGYGLTSGLESLDEREQETWKTGIRAGNLYINRGTTGAVTLRQPFGGIGKSAIGPGFKAGGPTYVAHFMEFEENAYPEAGPVGKAHFLLRVIQDWESKLKWQRFAADAADLKKTVHAVKSYQYHIEQTFEKEQDYFHLRGQDNILRFLPVGKMVVRIHENDTLFDVLARIAASRLTGCETIVSIPKDCDAGRMAFLETEEGKQMVGDVPVVYQEDNELIAMLPQIDRIRYGGKDRAPQKLLKAAAKSGLYIARSPVMMDGRIELLQYYRQQSICDSYHRYGNLGERALDI